MPSCCGGSALTELYLNAPANNWLQCAAVLSIFGESSIKVILPVVGSIIEAPRETIVM